jgi:hypothetical protein
MRNTGALSISGLMVQSAGAADGEGQHGINPTFYLIIQLKFADGNAKNEC